ncbi:hypothetical protein HYW21_08895 [Candidatus Woesearchaeota archaeon]|nr:hypothetical protein [Candidatus Woesearchaeota archaeon]
MKRNTAFETSSTGLPGNTDTDGNMPAGRDGNDPCSPPERVRSMYRLGDRLYSSAPLRHLGATGIEIAVLNGVIHVTFPDIVDDARHVVYDLRHSGRTVGEMLHGGPEGMRSIEVTIDEALQTLYSTSANDPRSAQLREQLLDQEGFTRELATIYQQNETLTTQAQRLLLQLGGAVSHTNQLGTDIRDGWSDSSLPGHGIVGWWKDNVDARLEKGRAQLEQGRGRDGYQGLTQEQAVAEAKARSELINTFFNEVAPAYDARERNEDTVRQLYDNARAENQALGTLFPRISTYAQDAVTGTVRNTYKVEQSLWEKARKGTDITIDDVAGAQKDVHNYTQQVEQTREAVGDEVPLQDYHGGQFLDYTVNGPMLAAVAVLGGKFLVRRIPFVGKPTDNGITRLVAYPLKLVGNGMHAAYDAIHDRIVDRYSGHKPQESPKLQETGEQTGGNQP